MLFNYKHKTLGMSLFNRRYDSEGEEYELKEKYENFTHFVNNYLSIILLNFPYQSKLYNAFHTTGKIMTIKTLQIHNYVMFNRC